MAEFIEKMAEPEMALPFFMDISGQGNLDIRKQCLGLNNSPYYTS